MCSFQLGLNDHLLGKELYIQFNMHVFCECLSICMLCMCFPFLCEGAMFDLILVVPNQCLSFFFVNVPLLLTYLAIDPN